MRKQTLISALLACSKRIALCGLCSFARDGRGGCGPDLLILLSESRNVTARQFFRDLELIWRNMDWAFSPCLPVGYAYLERCPRLVWSAPLAQRFSLLALLAESAWPGLQVRYVPSRNKFAVSARGIALVGRLLCGVARFGLPFAGWGAISEGFLVALELVEGSGGLAWLC